MSKLDSLAEYAETHDFANEMDDAVWETEVDPDPMITTSLRLPKSLLDWVRTQAAEQHVRPTTLIRQWIEQHYDAESEDLTTRVSRLEHAVFPERKAS